MIFNNKKYSIPKITIGCEALGGTDWGKKDINELSNVLNKSFDYGFNCFDTADVYGLGESERKINEIFREKTKEIFIISKFGIRWNNKETKGRATTYKDLSVNYLREALEGSLKRLKIDAIPLYLVHWPDNRYDIDQIISELKSQKEKGKIINFGLSNFSLKDISLNSLNEIDAICNSFNLLDQNSNKNILIEGHKLNKSIFVYGTLAQGLLTGKYSKDSHFEADDRRSRLDHFKKNYDHNLEKIIKKILEISKNNKESAAQVVHKWIVSKKIADSSIIGISNVSQLEELMKVSDSKLQDKYIEELDYLGNQYINKIEKINL